jgi:signal transduction histidine kinase
LIVDRMLARGKRLTTPAAPVREVLATAGSRWSRQAELAQVSLTMTVEQALPPDVTSVGLPDVLDPIADNALRHTPEGGWVVVAARADLESGCIVVDITNSGPGVPTDLAPLIFDAWVSSRDASVAGGLGLWLSRETARDAGGDVRLIDPDAGHTTFRATLPIGDGGVA